MSSFTPTIEPLPEHPFWRFSCLVYQQRSLKLACLSLQNQLGMNVNVILFACWLAAHGRGRLQPASFAKLDHLIATWHQCITLKLRHFRQWLVQQKMAGDNFTLISALQQQELAAEQVEQLLLAQHSASILPRDRTGLQKVSDAVTSLQNYATYLDVKLRAEECQWLADILQVIFNRISAMEVDQLCGVTRHG